LLINSQTIEADIDLSNHSTSKIESILQDKTTSVGVDLSNGIDNSSAIISTYETADNLTKQNDSKKSALDPILIGISTLISIIALIGIIGIVVAINSKSNLILYVKKDFLIQIFY
jgi:hypothetical protein